MAECDEKHEMAVCQTQSLSDLQQSKDCKAQIIKTVLFDR